MGYWMGWERVQDSVDESYDDESSHKPQMKTEEKVEVENEIHTCEIRFGYPTRKQICEKYWKWPIFVLDLRNNNEYARLIPDETGCNFKVTGEHADNVKIIKEEVLNGSNGGYRHIIVQAPEFSHLMHRPDDTQFFKY